jgi:hypothetical protein
MIQIRFYRSNGIVFSHSEYVLFSKSFFFLNHEYVLLILHIDDILLV